MQNLLDNVDDFKKSDIRHINIIMASWYDDEYNIILLHSYYIIIILL